MTAQSKFLDEKSVDDIIEIPMYLNSQYYLTKKQKLKRLILKYKWETVALAVLMLGIAVILSSVLIYVKSQNNKNLNQPTISEESSISKWTTFPTSAPIGIVTKSPTFSSEISSSITISPTVMRTTSAPVTSLAVPPSSAPFIYIDPVYPSLKDQLHHVFGEHYSAFLEDPESPQSMAYEWIINFDKLRWSHNNPSVIQRYVLAVFYFATGGRRVIAPWYVCSAVPSNPTEGRNVFQTRCVTENGTTICAGFEEFEECSEYYERFDLKKPEKTKKRWLSWTAECDWYGVYCDDDGQITQISMPKNGLVGKLVSEFSALVKVNAINLRENYLVGTLPSWDTLNLQHLSLSDNALEGTIPSEWKVWIELKTLDLANNQLTGSLQLPNGWFQMNTMILGGQNRLNIEMTEDLGLTVELETLDLHENSIVSDIPHSLSDLFNLMEFNVAGCGLLGTLPDLATLVKLVDLQLQGNAFSGNIPEALWELTDLDILRLEDNTLSGTLSSGVGNLVNLKEFRVSGAGLEGNLPQELSNLEILERAHFEFNSFKGNVPDDLCEVPTLKDLQADCDGNGSKVVKCSCCTQCCSLKRGKCNNPK